MYNWLFDKKENRITNMNVKQNRESGILMIYQGALSPLSNCTTSGAWECPVTRQTVIVEAADRPLSTVYSKASDDMPTGSTHSTEKEGRGNVAAVY